MHFYLSMTPKDTFFVSTPIYYTNGIPHIGHSYSSIIADSLARYHRISGKRVKFSTGVDENSQKIVESAHKEGKDIMDYLDKMAYKHQNVWDGLGIQYTDFIRTTEKRHYDLVQEVLQKSFDVGDIYKWEYEGKYCVGCEAFKKDDDLIERDGILVCPDHLKAPDTIKEKNYFFKLSKYQKELEDYYATHPSFVVPQDRFNEVIAFVGRGLEDFSISRETNKFGIPLPFDPSQVTYVWYDALFNYVTVCENGDEDFWPADLHVVGKDIIRFHAIYWPAMLLSAGYELPKNILTTGFFTVDGQKISKSLGNVIDPVEFSTKYNKDMLVLYLLSTFNIGQDGDFDQKQAILTYNAKLANNLGNLVNRVVVLALKLTENSWVLEGIVSNDMLSLNQNNPEWLLVTRHLNNQSEKRVMWFTGSMRLSIDLLVKEISLGFYSYDLKYVLDFSFLFLDKLNKFADEKQPWQMIKTDEEGTREVLYTLAEWLRQVGLALYPFFPTKMAEMFEKLGLKEYQEQLESGKLQELLGKQEIFYITEKGEALFARIEIEK
jgi:methionyl-tRNA synthetase